MQRRERQERLAECWELLARVDMGLVVAAIANTELKGPHTAGPGPASSSSPGERAAEEIRDSEQEARRAVQKLREALGDAISEVEKVVCERA